MPKRSEKRDAAKAEYLARKGRGELVDLRELAEGLGVNYQTLRNWKSADEWEKAEPKKKRGGQPGNRNSAGHKNAAGSHKGAPTGNHNAEKDGAYDIECDEQDGADSSYYNTLCQNYGLVLKVYARRLWVYDREAYKAKRAVRTFDRTDIIRGSLSWTTTLSGTYTGGTFDYTDADKDCDISCKVGGGTHIKSVNRRAISVQDAAVQLCAELNRANHGTIKLRFTVPGDWTVSAKPA